MNRITLTHAEISGVFVQAAKRVTLHRFACNEIRNVIDKRFGQRWQLCPRDGAIDAVTKAVIREFTRMFKPYDQRTGQSWFGDADVWANADRRVTALLLAAHAHELGGVSVPYYDWRAE